MERMEVERQGNSESLRRLDDPSAAAAADSGHRSGISGADRFGAAPRGIVCGVRYGCGRAARWEPAGGCARRHARLPVAAGCAHRPASSRVVVHCRSSPFIVAKRDWSLRVIGSSGLKRKNARDRTFWLTTSCRARVVNRATFPSRLPESASSLRTPVLESMVDFNREHRSSLLLRLKRETREVEVSFGNRCTARDVWLVAHDSLLTASLAPHDARHRA